MKIDPKSATPVYQQIVEGIQSEIASGIFREGEEIPSTRGLAMKLQVNPNTVQKAYEELVRLGVLESRRGKGKIVARRGEASAVKHSEQTVVEAFEKGVRVARNANITDKRIRELLGKAMQLTSKRMRA